MTRGRSQLLTTGNFTDCHSTRSHSIGGLWVGLSIGIPQWLPPHCQSILYIFRDVKRRIITCRWNPGLRISRLMTTHIHFVNLCTFCTLLKSTILAGTIFRHDSIRFYTAYSREAVGHISGGALLLFKVIDIGGPYQETPDSEIHESAP